MRMVLFFASLRSGGSAADGRKGCCMNVQMGEIGEPKREHVITPEREPVPERIVVPDSPEGLPMPKREDVPA